ncbi:MAG TPA: glycosyltransferase family 9 protein [Thermomicrobiales bacterium]|nr:glycosyltransferase family 9 protein [Thermomicrobiales bacterium]
MALPAIDALAHAATRGVVDVFAGQHSMAVFKGRDTVALVIACPERFTAASAVRFGTRDLRAIGAQTLVVLDRSRLLRLALSVSGARSRHWIVGDPDEQRHESDVYLDLVRSMGIETRDATPRMTPPKDALAVALDLIPADHDFAVIHPGGGENPGTRMTSKRWPVAHYVELAAWLTRQSLAVYLTGSKSDRLLCERVAHEARLGVHAVLAGACDIPTSGAIISRSRLYVGGDTGVSHIAAAVGAPVVAIFGPTNPQRYRPLGERVVVVAPTRSWAIPDADLRKSRQRESGVSIEQVSTEEIIDACKAVLAMRSSDVDER